MLFTFLFLTYFNIWDGEFQDIWIKLFLPISSCYECCCSWCCFFVAGSPRSPKGMQFVSSSSLARRRTVQPSCQARNNTPRHTLTFVRVTLQNKSANFFHAFYWCHRPDWSWRIRYRKYHALPWTASPRTLNPLPILRYVCSQCRTHIYGFLSFLFYHFYFLAIPVGTQSS